MPIAILSAMEQEADSIVAAMTVRDEGEAGRRRWWRGTLLGEDIVVAHSHWGKVAAASTATWLIARFAPSELLFTGVAGAIAPGLRVGDVVVGERLWQHDMDARPILERHQIPLLGEAALAASAAPSAALVAAARAFLGDTLERALPAAVRARFALDAPSVHVGGIASGDRFVHEAAVAAEIRERLPETLCVEMEGAAVAQVCRAFGLPFSICRTISDTADAAAAHDFTAFVEEVARVYALGIVENRLRATREERAAVRRPTRESP